MENVDAVSIVFVPNNIAAENGCTVRIRGSPDAAGPVYLLSHNTFTSNTTCYVYMKSSLIRIRGLQISYSRKIDFRFQSSPARHVFPSPHIPQGIHFPHSSSLDTRRGFQRAARVRADHIATCRV